MLRERNEYLHVQKHSMSTENQFFLYTKSKQKPLLAKDNRYSLFLKYCSVYSEPFWIYNSSLNYDLMVQIDHLLGIILTVITCEYV